MTIVKRWSCKNTSGRYKEAFFCLEAERKKSWPEYFRSFCVHNDHCLHINKTEICIQSIAILLTKFLNVNKQEESLREVGKIVSAYTFIDQHDRYLSA